MKVLIYGSKGWIGKQFIEIIKKNNIEYFEGKVHVENEKELVEELKFVKPTHVISFIGRTNGVFEGEKITTIDYLEKKGKLYENIRDNLYSPFLLAYYCKMMNIHYTYIGTGCIFKFDETHDVNNGFTEESNANFFGSSYSTVKGFTDKMMKMYDVLNLRIRMPITQYPNERNFITKITNYKKICSIPNSMTVLPELLPYALDMMMKNIVGTFNFTNKGCITHNEILDMYKEIVDNNFKYENFTIEEQNKILLGERSNNFLDTAKLETLYPEMKNIKDSIRDCLIEYKENFLV